MEDKFNKNGVLTGVIDAFCLSCESYLKKEDIHQHIADKSHLDTFQGLTYVEKYKEDHVRKVKAGYYCEVCNIVIQTIAKIALHVEEDIHVDNKNKVLIKRCEGGVVVSDNILIKMNAWHGLADGSCLICEADYSNEEDHKKQQTHLLNLIQSKVEFKENFIYRKIDKDSYNCLICNTIIMKDSQQIHCESSEHKDNYLKCLQNTLPIAENANDNIKNIKFDEKGIALSVETNNLEENVSIIANKTSSIPINQVDDNEILSPAEALAKAKKFAKTNNLKYKINSAYCKLCNVTISSSLKRMKEHVAEASHRASTQNQTKIKLNKLLTSAYIHSLHEIKHLFFHGVIINNQYCVPALGFIMMTNNDDRARCLICEINVTDAGIDHHQNSAKHLQSLRNTVVLTDFVSEFVREFRPHVYHCGYCNLVERNLDQMKNHLKSVNHMIQKKDSQWWFEMFKTERRTREFLILDALKTMFE